MQRRKFLSALSAIAAATAIHTLVDRPQAIASAPAELVMLGRTPGKTKCTIYELSADEARSIRPLSMRLPTCLVPDVHQ